MIAINCRICGKEIKKYPSEIKKGRVYCSKECGYKATSTHMKENNPFPRNRINVLCHNCGKQYGIKLSVLKAGEGKYCSKKCYTEYNRGENHKQYKPKMLRQCKCCKNNFLVRVGEVEKGWGNFCSRQCMFLFQKRENHPAYIDGVSTIERLIRVLPEYKQWRMSVFSRDGFKCVLCDEKGDIEAHHKKPFITILSENNITNLVDAESNRNLWEVSNGETLCLDHHKEKHKTLGYIRRKVQGAEPSYIL